MPFYTFTQAHRSLSNSLVNTSSLNSQFWIHQLAKSASSPMKLQFNPDVQYLSWCIDYASPSDSKQMGNLLPSTGWIESATCTALEW